MNEQKIGSLIVELSTNIAKYQEGLKKANQEAQYKESMNDLGLVSTAIKVNIGQELIPVLTQLGAWFAGSGVTAISEFSKSFRDGIRWVADWGTEIEFAYKKYALLMGQGTPAPGVTGGLLKMAGGSLFYPLTSKLAKDMVDPRSKSLADLEAQKQKELMDRAKILGNAASAASPVSEGNSSRLASEVEAVRKLNERIQESINKRNLNALELIDQQAAAWRKEGADELLVAEYVAAEKGKINDDLMRTVFKQLEDGMVKRAEVEQEAAKKAAEAIKKEQEERIKAAESLVNQNQTTREYNDAVKELLELINPTIMKDAELAKAESILAAERKKLAVLTDELIVATAKADQLEIARLNEKIKLQSQYNLKLEDNLKLEQDVSVIMGKIVGFDNGRAIYSDEWKTGGYYGPSAGEVARQRMAAASGTTETPIPNYDAWGAPAGTFYDINGNVLSLPKYALGTDYVPRTGPAIVHQGERIIPAGQNASSAPVTINGGITISLPNVTRADDYDSIARGISQSLRKYQSRQL